MARWRLRNLIVSTPKIPSPEEKAFLGIVKKNIFEYYFYSI